MNAPSTSQLPSFSCKLCRQSSAGAGSTTVSPGGYIDAYSTSVSVLLVETEASEACCIGHDRAAMALLETEVWSIIILCGSLVHEARGPTKEVKALCLNIRPSDQLDDPGLTNSHSLYKQSSHPQHFENRSSACLTRAFQSPKFQTAIS